MKKKTITYKIKCNHTIGKIHPIDERGMYCEFENRYLTEKEITKLLKKLKTVNLLSEAKKK